MYVHVRDCEPWTVDGGRWTVDGGRLNCENGPLPSVLVSCTASTCLQGTSVVQPIRASPDRPAPSTSIGRSRSSPSPCPDHAQESLIQHSLCLSDRLSLSSALVTVNNTRRSTSVSLQPWHNILGAVVHSLAFPSPPPSFSFYLFTKKKSPTKYRTAGSLGKGLATATTRSLVLPSATGWQATDTAAPGSRSRPKPAQLSASGAPRTEPSLSARPARH
jgi:hypothetical protein